MTLKQKAGLLCSSRAVIAAFEQRPGYSSNLTSVTRKQQIPSVQSKPRGAEPLWTKGKVKTCHREDRAPLWACFPSLPLKGHPSAVLILCICWMLPARTNQDVLAAAGSTRDLKVGSQIGDQKSPAHPSLLSPDSICASSHRKRKQHPLL